MSAPVIDLAAVPRIAPDEHRARQARARALAAERGFDALAAWSRGGTTQDRYAEVFWLTGFYTHFPTIGDAAGSGRARGHCAAVLGPDGTELVVDVRQLRPDDGPVADDVRFASDPLAGLAEALERALPSGGRVALLGGDALAGRWSRWLAARLPRHELVEVDELGHALRLVKSPAEQRLLRAAGVVGSAALDAAMDAAVPGASESDVVAAAAEHVLRAGGALYGLGLSAGPWAHTFSPTRPAAWDGRRRFAEGDMVRLDLYGSIDGYLFDLARSRVVGRAPDGDQQSLLDAVVDCVAAGVAAIRPGATIGAIAERCEAALLASDYAARFEVAASPLGSWGHSLGVCWEAPWIEADNPLGLVEGMCLAVELRIEQPGVGGAQHEENVLVVEGGAELLSSARVYR